jgi:GAF domain-containing protein
VTAGSTLAPSLAAVRSLFGAAACSCALVDPDGAALTYVAADGEGAAGIVGVRLPVERGIAGWAAMSGQPLAVRDVQSDPRFARDVADATRYVPTTIMAAPMFDAVGEVAGVVSVLDPTVEQAGDWALAVLGTLASQLAVLVRLERAGPGPERSRLAELGRAVLALAEDHRR